MQFSVISTALLGLFYFDEIPSGLQVMGSRIIMLVFRGVNKPTNDGCRETLKQFGTGGYRDCGFICAKLH